MGDSKIIRQLRYHHGAHSQQSQGEAPIRGYGSGHQAQRVSGASRSAPHPSIVPGAPDGPVAQPRPGASAAVTSPNPHNGLTRRPGQINVTPGIGGDTVKVGRALAPSERALGMMPPATVLQGEIPARAARMTPVVAIQGLTRPQRDLLDALLDKCHDANVSDEPNASPSRIEQRASIVELVSETKAAIARLPVAEARTMDAPDGAAGDVEDLEAPTPVAPRRASSARPSRVGMGGTNPPGEVRIFAPNTQPFETRAGRQSNEHDPGRGSAPEPQQPPAQ